MTQIFFLSFLFCFSVRVGDLFYNIFTYRHHVGHEFLLPVYNRAGIIIWGTIIIIIGQAWEVFFFGVGHFRQMGWLFCSYVAKFAT